MKSNKPIINDEEAGMAKVEEDELRRSTRPLLIPPKTSPKEHPTMAVYVAISMQPKTEAQPKKGEESVKSSLKSESRSIKYTDLRKKKTSSVQTKQESSSKSTVKSTKTHPSQIKQATLQIQLPDEEKYDPFSDTVSSGTITEDDSGSPRADQPEEVFSVEFVSDARQLADRHHRAQRLVAKEAFSSVTEQTAEQKTWMKELVCEAKPLLMNALFSSPLLEPEKRSTLFRIREEKKPIKVPPASVLAQNLMQSLISEIFDPAKMLEMHVAVRLPPATGSDPSSEGGNNYAVGITTSVKVDQLCSTKSCVDQNVCRTEKFKFAKTVFSTEICGRPVLIDDRFFETVLHHMEWNEAKASWSTQTQTSDRTPSAGPSTLLPIIMDETVKPPRVDESDLYYYKLIANMHKFPRSVFSTDKDYLCFNCGYEYESGQQRPCIRHQTKSTPAYRK